MTNDQTYDSPRIDAGTDKAAAACILILKFEESRSSSRRILKTDGALSKEWETEYNSTSLY